MIEDGKLPVNLLVVSDHGMAQVDPQNHLILDEFLPNWRTLISWIDFGPVTSIWPLPQYHEQVYSTLEKGSNHFKVYERGHFPPEWNFDRVDSSRIPPIVILCENGFVLDYEQQGRERRPILGYHGYDPHDPDMEAVLLASGPDITMNPDTELSIVPNVQVYSLLAHLLQIDSSQQAANNGTDYLINLICADPSV